MIDLKIRPLPHLRTSHYFEYYDPVQRKDVYLRVEPEDIERTRLVLHRRLGSEDVRLVTVYLEVEVE